MEILKKNSQWRCYKPKKDGKGAASRIEVKIVKTEKQSEDGKKFEIRDVQAFLVSSPQEGEDQNKNAKFSWSNKDDKKSVTMKLGENDIGEMLAVLNGIKNKAGTDSGIFHQNPNGNTTLSFEYNNANDRKYYSLRLAKKGKDGKLVAVSHLVSVGEAQILKVLLERIILTTYNW